MFKRASTVVLLCLVSCNSRQPDPPELPATPQAETADQAIEEDGFTLAGLDECDAAFQVMGTTDPADRARVAADECLTWIEQVEGVAPAKLDACARALRMFSSPTACVEIACANSPALGETLNLCEPNDWATHQTLQTAAAAYTVAALAAQLSGPDVTETMQRMDALLEAFRDASPDTRMRVISTHYGRHHEDDPAFGLAAVYFAGAVSRL